MCLHSENVVFLLRRELHEGQKTVLGVSEGRKSCGNGSGSVVLLENMVRVVVWAQNVR